MHRGRTRARARVRLRHQPIQNLSRPDHPELLPRRALLRHGIGLERPRRAPQRVELHLHRPHRRPLLGELAPQLQPVERAVFPALEGQRQQHDGRHDPREFQPAHSPYSPLPGKNATSPSSSAMRSSWLYFATRSVRDALPVLICPTPVATARSAMKVSSVSPERCEITAPYPLERACAMHCSVSVSDPIWFSLIRIALATLSSIPRSNRSMLVQNRSSPTSCTRADSAAVSFAQPAQSSSASPSSIDTIG